MAKEKQNKQKKTNNNSILKKFLIILLVLGMIGLYVIMPIMSAGI